MPRAQPAVIASPIGMSRAVKASHEKKPRMISVNRKVLVVDDDKAMRDMVVALLEDAGHSARGAAGVDRALEFLGDGDFDAVISDIRMPGRSGIELLGAIRELRPETPIILMTAFGSIDSAVEAMQAGAFDYVTKPFKRDAVLISLERAFEHRNLEQENRRLRKAVDRTSSFGEMIGASSGMREIFAMIRKVSDSRSSVLITGESGTGKELVARTLHYSGARSKQPFVPVNCTAIPDGLMESELFGHVRGAFTGAISSKRGLFEEANGGTIFLDEIGDMSPNLQVKLLRVLQERTFEPVGSSKTIKVDVRVIAATNQHLEQLIEQKQFREDLYYRLNVLPIEAPPLRDRTDDIPLLVHHFIDIGNQQRNSQIDGISEEAVKLLMNYRWPGNVRELENMIERVMILRSQGEILAEDLPAQFRQSRERSPQALRVPANGISFKEVIGEFETDLILQALDQTHWNKNRAAQLLGLNRTTLLEKIKKKGLEPQSP